MAWPTIQPASARSTALNISQAARIWLIASAIGTARMPISGNSAISRHAEPTLAPALASA